MNNTIFYKNINGLSLDIEFIYEPRINLCGGKHIASILKVVLVGLDCDKQNSFFIDSDDLALEKGITPEEADSRLIAAITLFNSNKNINILKNNPEINSLLNKVDLYIK